MSKRLKPTPKFANEAEERAFWESPKNDSTEYVDWSKARLAVLPKLKPSETALQFSHESKRTKTSR